MASCDTDATYRPIVIHVGQCVVRLVEVHCGVFETLYVFFVVVACTESKNEGHDRKGQRQFCKDFIHNVNV